MSLISLVRTAYERLLEWIVFTLVVLLTLLVIAGAAFRYAGHALDWYDEVASVGLVWLTYYGAALAALRGSHIGVAGVVNIMPPRWRLVLAIVAEAFVFLFFGVLAITGFEVLNVLQGSHLVSLPSVSLTITQSAIPIGAVLFMIAEAFRLPEVFSAALHGGYVDLEVKEALEEALQHAGQSAENEPAKEPRP